MLRYLIARLTTTRIWCSLFHGVEWHVVKVDGEMLPAMVCMTCYLRVMNQRGYKRRRAC